MLFVLSTGFGVFGSNPVSNYLHAVIAYLPLVFVAILIVIIAAAIAAGAKTLIQNSLGGLSYAPVLANAAAAVIIALGVVAALDQLHIAAAVVNAVLYAVLAAATGVIIVAVGGGGIKTMSARWELLASRYDQEKVQVQQQLRSAPTVVRAGQDPAGAAAVWFIVIAEQRAALQLVIPAPQTSGGGRHHGGRLRRVSGENYRVRPGSSTSTSSICSLRTESLT